jgi:signal peptide peptidase SppA
MSEKKYPHILRAVSETPWAILPSKLAAILDMLALRASGQQLTAEEIQARIGKGPPHRDASQAGTVVVLPLYGVIAPHADAMTDVSGGTSVDTFAANFRSVIADDSVKAIVLDVDSPGGTTDLVSELATEIRSARGTKPIVAVANTMAASAAYWIMSQADEIVVTPSGSVGSIGVFAAHDDVSGLQDQLGVKTTLISAGKYKVEGNPFEPLTDEAKQAIQDRVDEAYDMFVNDVAKGRGVSATEVKSGFGEGRMVSAAMAVNSGMADRVATLGATIARVANPNGRSRVGSSAMDNQVDTQAAAIEDIVEDPPPDTEEEESFEAAESGLSFADTVDRALRAMDAVVTRSEQLRSLTVAKRDQLTALIERAAQVRDEHDPAKVIDDDLAFDAERVFAEIRL